MNRSVNFLKYYLSDEDVFCLRNHYIQWASPAVIAEEIQTRS